MDPSRPRIRARRRAISSAISAEIGIPLLLLSLCVLGACARQGPPAGRTPNLLFVVIDTLRADRLGSYGNERGLTPFLDELASRGTLFRNAYAASSWTVPSVASLFTSRYPAQHQVLDFESVVADEEVTLAERLAEQGFATGGFTANLRMLERFGYGQGFEHWRSYGFRKRESGLTKKPRGPGLRRDALHWLDRRAAAAGPAPFFLYVHYLEPHPPYLPPEPWRGRFGGGETSPALDDSVNLKLMDLTDLFGETLTREEIALLESLYDGEVAAVDDEVRLLFRELELRGFLDHAVVVVTADHGEEFKEHGRVLHGFTLYEESVRVPLLVLLPGDDGGRVVEEPVSLVDLAPTLLELLGAPAEPRFEGRSLAPLLRGERSGEGDGVFSQLLGPPHLRRHAAAWVEGDWKLLVDQAGRQELYDLGRDPGESSPGGPAARASAMGEALEQRAGVLASRANDGPVEGEVTEELRRGLEALGYLVE